VKILTPVPFSMILITREIYLKSYLAPQGHVKMLKLM
jgi:hypothetical protein